MGESDSHIQKRTEKPGSTNSELLFSQMSYFPPLIILPHLNFKIPKVIKLCCACQLGEALGSNMHVNQEH